MRRKIENTIIYTCGGFVLGLGVVGLFLPILQGVVLIVLGLYIISLRSVRAQRLLNRILEKYPSIRTLGLKSSKYAKVVAHKVGMFF